MASDMPSGAVPQAQSHEKPNAPKTAVRSISQQGVTLIKQFEGFVPTIYSDGRFPTIGYGHLLQSNDFEEVRQAVQALLVKYAEQPTQPTSTEMPALHERTYITEEEGKLILRDDICTRANILPYLDPAAQDNLTQPQFDAMTSLCFNVGTGWFQRSDVRAHFNANNLPLAAEGFTHFCRAGKRMLPGLVKRRFAELFVFTGQVMDPRSHMLPSVFFQANDVAQWRITDQRWKILADRPELKQEAVRIARTYYIIQLESDLLDLYTQLRGC